MARGARISQGPTDRRDPRFSVALPIEFRVEQEGCRTFSMRSTKNVSRRGACVAGAVDLDVGSEVDASIVVDRQSESIRARLVWVSDGEFGIEVVGADLPVRVKAG